MLIDYVKLNLKAGDGGDGVVRWRREHGIPFGGPAGGDGGKGGDIYIEVVRDIQALSDYKFKKDWEANKGENGKKRSMHGSHAEDLILKVPVGSIVTNLDFDITYECNTDGEKIRILKGGWGGLGNEKFKSATNRAPEEFTHGQKGESGAFKIELKLIADIGIIGKPNAGKSSLLNTLTRAGAKVGDYPFTTIEPNLGVYYKLVMADIPGLIEGASDGKGLGIKFLRHVSRTKVLLHLISADSHDFVKEYQTIRKELEGFDNSDISQNNNLKTKKEIIVISKIDTISNNSKDDFTKRLKDFEDYISSVKDHEILNKSKIIELSLFDDKSVKELGQILLNTLN